MLQRGNRLNLICDLCKIEKFLRLFLWKFTCYLNGFIQRKPEFIKFKKSTLILEPKGRMADVGGRIKINVRILLKKKLLHCMKPLR